MKNVSKLKIEFRCYVENNYRENPHITKEEWELLRSVDINTANPITPLQSVFHSALVNAVSRLLNDLNIDGDVIPSQRIYRLQLLPKTEDVCTVPSSFPLKSSPVEKGYLTLPLQIFETIHLCAYNLNFISICNRLSLLIEHSSTYIQYEQRNSLLEKDINVYANVLKKLDEFQHRLTNIWKTVRWIGDVASTARNKQAEGLVTMQRLFAVGRGINDRSCHKQGTSDSNDSTDALHFDLCNMLPQSVTSLNKSLPEPSLGNYLQQKKDPTTTVVKVHAAYHCGLTCATSVRLQITSTTTASEIVALVIEKLTKAAVESGEAIESKDPEEFCLAVVVGSRERRLRDEFPLMKLQDPWDDGRLFVRRRDSVLAALRRGNEAAV